MSDKELKPSFNLVMDLNVYTELGGSGRWRRWYRNFNK
jgi:hypothetical protein